MDLSLPAPTTADLALLATGLLLIEHETVALTVIAIAWVTGWPTPAALLAAGSSLIGRPAQLERLRAESAEDELAVPVSGAVEVARVRCRDRCRRP